MRPVEGRADAVGKVMGDEPVDGLAFRRHGAALGGRDARPDLGKLGQWRRAGIPSGPSLSARISARCTIRSA